MEIFSANNISGLFALTGVILGFGGTFFISYLGRKSENSRHIRELGLKVGLANFEHAMIQGQKIADKTEEMIEIAPLHLHIMEGIRLVEIVSDTSLSADEIARKMSEVRAFSETIIRAGKAIEEPKVQK